MRPDEIGSSLRDRDFERILIIKPSALGDVIHTVPVLAKLRARYPRARIDWLLTPQNADLIRSHPGLSSVIDFDRGGYSRLGRSLGATLGPLRLIADLRRPRYDLVIDLHGQFRSALLALATGSRTRIGFDRPERGLWGSIRMSGPSRGWTGAREGAWLAYTHRIPLPTLEAHAVDRYLWLGELLGLAAGPPDFSLVVPELARERIKRTLQDRGIEPPAPLAVLVPCTIWATKHWTIEGFAEVGRRLISAGFAVAIAGSPRDRERCELVARLCPQAVNLAGETSVSELAALIERSTISVTNDSGSMHLAVALGRPVVSVFGPTDPVRIGPYGRPEAVVQAGVSCSPCHLRRLSECQHLHQCMTLITAERVFERVCTILEARKSA